MNVLLIVYMIDLNGALFLKVSFMFLLLALSSTLTFISTFTTIYASLQLHKSDLIIGVLDLIFLLILFDRPVNPFSCYRL